MGYIYVLPVILDSFRIWSFSVSDRVADQSKYPMNKLDYVDKPTALSESSLLLLRAHRSRCSECLSIL